MVALHFGRQWELKGGDVFLETMARLRAGPFPGLIAMSPRGGEPARALAAELGLGGALLTPDDVNDVRDLYAASDVLMATSRGEGMPLTVLEALAGGLPVVASDIPGHRHTGRGAARDGDRPARSRCARLRCGAALDRGDRRRPARPRPAVPGSSARWACGSWARRLADLYEGFASR